MQVHAVTMARQGDIAAVGVHARCRQNMGAIHRHALRLVNGRGIAVVDLVVVLQVERDIPAVIGAHRHGLRADLFDGPVRAVPDPKSAFVLQEHDAIPTRKTARPALDRQTNVLTQIAGGSHPLARGLIEGTHLVVRMGEDDAAAVWGGLPVAVPAVDQIVARLLACLRHMHHAMGVIGMDRFAGPAGRQTARGIALPVLALTANLADFRRRHDAHGWSGRPRRLRWIATA